MKYDEILALLMDGQMGYLPNDGISYSLLIKKLHNGNPCECIFFYGVNKGKAKGPWRVILFDCMHRTILENITNLSHSFHIEEPFECDLEVRNIEEAIKLMADYKVTYDAVSCFAFQEQLDAVQKELVGKLSLLLRENAGNMYGIYQLIAPEFIEWMDVQSQ